MMTRLVQLVSQHPVLMLAVTFLALGPCADGCPFC